MIDEILQNWVLRLVAATNKYLYLGGPNNTEGFIGEIS